ncbi:MAG: hypothetical protein ABGY72_23245 [bacterium]
MLNVRLSPVTLNEGVTLLGVHPYVASRTLAERLAAVSRDTTSSRADRSDLTTLVERPAMTRDWRHLVVGRLFWTRVEDACGGYVPVWLSHLDVVRAWRPFSAS